MCIQISSLVTFYMYAHPCDCLSINMSIIPESCLMLLFSQTSPLFSHLSQYNNFFFWFLNLIWIDPYNIYCLNSFWFIWYIIKLLRLIHALPCISGWWWWLLFIHFPGSLDYWWQFRLFPVCGYYNKSASIFLRKIFHGHMLSYLLNIFLGVKFLSNRMGIYSTPVSQWNAVFYQSNMY